MWKMIIIVVVAALLGAGGFLYYQSSQQKLANPPAETMVSPSPTEEPTPTPEEVDRTEYTIEVLNGSGIAGKAGDVQTLLEDEGFTVDSTGNADSYDYEETVIQAGEDVSPAFLQALRDVLREKYDVDSTFDAIEGDSDADVVVIVGQNDASGTSMVEEETEESTTPTPTEEVTESVTPSPTP